MQLADSNGMKGKVNYVSFAVVRERPRLEARPPGFLFVVDTLHVESPWLYTYILDQSRLDKIVSAQADRV